ncbi:hypothetical protein K456DRAFT_513094 [Colletotrichum gloeosporioides 23]|nr:hypothetical protein K456DRAFT_513094 [Colletotrichum gloeosporioides 23]
MKSPLKNLFTGAWLIISENGICSRPAFLVRDYKPEETTRAQNFCRRTEGDILSSYDLIFGPLAINVEIIRASSVLLPSFFCCSSN